MSPPLTSATALVDANWGTDAPDWLRTLAAAIDSEQGSLHGRQTAIARRIGYSNAVVHEVLRNKYRGNAANVADAVIRHLESQTADCPVLGPIAHEQCVRNQQAEFTTASPQLARLWRACRAGCRYSRQKSEGEVGC